MDPTVKYPFYQKIDGLTMPGAFSPTAFRDAVKYKPIPEDFFIVTFPKCGTTWTQQICYLIYNNGIPPKDAQHFFIESPFIEMTGPEAIDHMTRPAVIKTHLPYELTPMSDKAKYLYVVRNPKDSLVSFFHHTRTPVYRFSDGRFDDYFEVFVNGLNDFGDYFDHVNGWYAHKDDSNVTFITYEEMKTDIEKSVLRIAEFMGKQYRERLEKDKKFLDDVLRCSSLEYMKDTINDSLDGMFQTLCTMQDLDSSPLPSGFKHFVKTVSTFPPSEDDPKFHLIRKGAIGDWRSAFSEEQNRRMDERIHLKLAGTDLLKFWQSIGCLEKHV